VPTERIPIDLFLQTAATALLLDVRSPGEYKHAHMPGAFSLPLFTDEERAVVGTAYKQQSREQAIKIGLDFFGSKMRRMVEEVESLLVERCLFIGKQPNIEQRASNNVCLYCWRGGMRSSAIAWLLSLYGFNVFLLQGGYKRFRQWVIEKVAAQYELKIIGGYTGSGKTELLHHLQQQGETILDLEALASHKGSAFGNIGLPQQPSQEQFENKLALELYAKSGTSNPASGTATTKAQLQTTHFFKTPCPIWVEDESQRIGTINIPGPFWQTMRSAPIYFLDVPFEQRLQHLVEEYGCLNTLQMIEAIKRISKRLGPLETRDATRFLEEGNVEGSFRILLQYYDKQYRKALHNRQNLSTLLHTIPCETVGAGNAHLLSKPMAI
jgi:tRNA 2-selenouridine synthase